jgi:hypothetical protein
LKSTLTVCPSNVFYDEDDHFERIPGNIPGAYVSLESEIIRYIKYRVNPETDKIKIKISGGFSYIIHFHLQQYFLFIFLTVNIQKAK